MAPFSICFRRLAPDYQCLGPSWYCLWIFLWSSFRSSLNPLLCCVIVFVIMYISLWCFPVFVIMYVSLWCFPVFVIMYVSLWCFPVFVIMYVSLWCFPVFVIMYVSLWCFPVFVIMYVSLWCFPVFVIMYVSLWCFPVFVIMYVSLWCFPVFVIMYLSLWCFPVFVIMYVSLWCFPVFVIIAFHFDVSLMNQITLSSRKHAYIVLTPLNPTFIQYYYFFLLELTALLRIFHLCRADRSSKVGENRKPGEKPTWPSVSRRLSRMWPERGSNHSGEKLNELRVKKNWVYGDIHKFSYFCSNT